MSTATAKKFTFDLDLGSEHKRTRMVNETDIDAIRAAARAEGYAEGVAEGQRAEVARAAAELTQAGQRVAQTATQLLSSVDAAERQAHSDAVALARAIGTKLAARLIGREPEAELEPLIAECLASLETAPHLVVRCHPALAEKLQEITEAHMAANGYGGRLIVMGDPDIAVGDGRLEWADGGLVRDFAAISAQIDKAIAAYCASEELVVPELPAADLPELPAEAEPEEVASDVESDVVAEVAEPTAETALPESAGAETDEAADETPSALDDDLPTGLIGAEGDNVPERQTIEPDVPDAPDDAGAAQTSMTETDDE